MVSWFVGWLFTWEYFGRLSLKSDVDELTFCLVNSAYRYASVGVRLLWNLSSTWRQLIIEGADMAVAPDIHRIYAAL